MNIFYLILVVAGVIFFYLFVINLHAILKSRVVKSYICNFSYHADINSVVDNKVMGMLYFPEKISFVVYVGVTPEGIFIYSLYKFSIVIPWKNLAAVRVINAKGSILANLRLYSEGIVDRKLLIPWKNEFNSEIPLGVVVIVDS
ncbi:hypothetical protein [Zhongshania borealis]|uniref:DUF192 domain-containing protein n=1 Tax=Zhongshania borealis TaxID=889488 RepID=A0ABP7X8H7_9GAMM